MSFVFLTAVSCAPGWRVGGHQDQEWLDQGGNKHLSHLFHFVLPCGGGALAFGGRSPSGQWGTCSLMLILLGFFVSIPHPRNVDFLTVLLGDM